MTTDGGGWTLITYSNDLPYTNHFSGDQQSWLPTDFSLDLSATRVENIQSVSTEGVQEYVGLCNGVIHYYYIAGADYSNAFGFRFLDGSETVNGQQSYAPYDITVTQDGCKSNSGENGQLNTSTIFEIHSVKVPVINVNSLDNGGTTEYFGSPLQATQHDSDEPYHQLKHHISTPMLFPSG